jgi:tetratricopeptide (TPR) repeat protein
LTGCSSQGTQTGTKTSQPSQSSQPSAQPTKKVQSVIQDPRAVKYEGAANLAKYEAAAKANPNNAQDQFNAAISSFVNKKLDQAIQYYQATIKLDPKNGIAYNSLGNIYLYQMKQPSTALPYYLKATELIPNYAYGYLNKYNCEMALGNKAAAKATLQKGLSVIPSTDPLYPTLKKALTSLG